MSRLVVDPLVFGSGGSTAMLFDFVDMSRSKEFCASAVTFGNISGVSELEKRARSSSIIGGTVVGEVSVRRVWKDRTADSYISGCYGLRI